MFKDSFKHRKKYYTTLFVSIYVLIFTICSLVIAANWNYIKLLFEPKKEEISVEQQQFNELFAKVKYLEDLSKEYDEENYQLRAVMYIRSAQYPDNEWEYVLGESDEEFISFVELNEGDKDISSLRDLGLDYTFKNPATKQEVDFYRMFADLNAILLDNKAKIDAVGWGGYICENAILFKDKDLAVLKDEVKLNMQTRWISGDYMRFADYDSTNIYKILTTNPFAYDSLYLSIVTYYATFDKTVQIDNFIEYIGLNKESCDIVEDVYLTLQNNDFLQVLCDNAGFDFPDAGQNEDYSHNANVYKLVIEAYVELLGFEIEPAW